MMKKISSLFLGLVAVSSVGVAFVSTAEAGSVKATQVPVVYDQDENMEVAAFVAEGGTLSYELDGKTVVVPSGKSVIIPAGATNIQFTKGTIVTVKSVAVAKPVVYTVIKDVTLTGITQPELREHSVAFVPSHTPGVSVDGGVRIEDVIQSGATASGSAGTDSN